MDKEQIEQFITGLNKYHWHNHYRVFCTNLELNPKDKYSEEKLLHLLFQVCKEWWNYDWENGKFRFTFEPAITSKVTVL